MTIYRGRFAPSPTGSIHLGNVWTALLAWLDARQHGGAFVLRMEDLDPDRSRPHYATQLMADLRWLGLDWDEGPDIGGRFLPYVQDYRRDLYARALQRLEQHGLVYSCFCTRAEVRAAASAPHGRTLREQCVNQCWMLSNMQQLGHERMGRRPCLRIRITYDQLSMFFSDLCRGPQAGTVSETAGDFVLRRADGVHAYQLAVVVDDGDMMINHVVRGADLLDSTVRQLWLHRVLGYQLPQYAHVPLLVDEQGHRLSKRHAALAIAELRARGVKPTTIVGWLATWSGLIANHDDIHPAELLGLLDLARLPTTDIVVTSKLLL